MTGRWILIGLLAAAASTVLVAQPRSIASVRIFARPAAWSGRCPADLHFYATINANRWPVRVMVQWERSDGAVGTRRQIEVRGPHQRVGESWRLGRLGQRMEVWERLHVLAPTNIVSAPARVRVVCR